jgi:uncharacterized integral membrane protein (TIGR00697 family)
MLVWVYWVIGLTLSTIFCAWIVRRNRELGYTVLITIYSAYILGANVIAARLCEFDLGIFGVQIISTGSILWPFTGQVIDMINEVYGRRKTYIAVTLAYILNVHFVIFALLGLQVPPAPWLVQYESAYSFYFIQAPRVLVASWTTFIVCSLIDVTIFSKLKSYFIKRYGETDTINDIIKFVAIRNLISDVFNMALDGLLFAVLAFIFVAPMEAITSVIGGSIISKVLLTIIDTPWFIGYRIAIRGVMREF